jgi:hypothetical protein
LFATIVLAGRARVFALTFFTTAIGLIGHFIAKSVSATATTATKAVFVTFTAGFIATLATVLVKAVFARWAIWVELWLRGTFAAFSAFALCAFHSLVGIVTIVGFIIIARDHHFGAWHEGWLHGAQDAEVMFRMLQIVFAQDPVARRIGVAGELLVFFKHRLRRTPDFNVGSVRLIGAIWIVILWFLAWITSPTALPLHHASPVCFLAVVWPINAMSKPASRLHGFCVTASKRRLTRKDLKKRAWFSCN